MENKQANKNNTKNDVNNEEIKNTEASTTETNTDKDVESVHLENAQEKKSETKDIIIDETGIISEKMKVTGDITTDGHLVIYGEVEGNITARGNITVTGSVHGDITCCSLKLSNCQARSNLTVREKVVIDGGSRLEGNVQCGLLAVDGMIKGDIQAAEEINVYKNAKIAGSIKTKALGIESGAELQGNIMVVK